VALRAPHPGDGAWGQDHRPHHNIYGNGQCRAAIEAGATAVETSFGGLGGCPFTKVAAGNVATEDLVHGLQRSGECAGIDLAALIGVAREVAAFFGRDLPGCVYKIGPVPTAAPADVPVH
jgi:hydroxymethylglutaryl-CoA lyase